MINNACLDYGGYASKEARVRRSVARREQRAHTPAQHLPLPPTVSSPIIPLLYNSDETIPCTNNLLESVPSWAIRVKYINIFLS